MNTTRVVVAALLLSSPAYADETYQRPVKSVANLVDAPPIPSPSLGPDHNTLVLITSRSFPSIAEVAEPELRLAGLRINPKNYSQSRRGFAQKLELMDVKTTTTRPIRGIPDNARIGDVSWSPDGAYLAFTITTESAIEPWLVDVKAATAKRISQLALSGVIGRACEWFPDSKSLSCRTVPRGAKVPVPSTTVPTGPIVQENEGTKKPARTNPDLLQNAADEKLFEHYMTSQLVRLGIDGKDVAVGKPALYFGASPSPDGKLLLVNQIHKPFSYRITLGNFPLRTDVWSVDGKLVANIADLRLAEDIPVDFDAVRTGRRGIHWRSDAPATVCWVEAQDGGDVKKPAQIRDVVDCTVAPFTKPVRLASLALRYRGISWGSGNLALVREGWWKDRKIKTWIVAPDDAKTKPRVLWDRSSEDRYGDPGSPVMKRLPNGQWVIHVTSKGNLLLEGDGASDQGDRPFLDRLDLATGKSERVWRSEGTKYASIADVLDADGTEVLMSRESPTEPPQLYAYSFATKKERQLTKFTHPVPELAKITKQLVKWKRKDGLELSGMLYLPPGFKPKQDRPLPVVVWVYPQEFKSANAASQVSDSPYRFVYPWWGGPLFALTQGYAVVDDPAFAIVGEGKTEPNDTYVEQLTDDASSLIDHLVTLGVGDRERFAVGGHSYGAFTTANLLAHTNLFRTGVARSGAYNRTLTPFGFQSEERTYWEAAATYDRLSPFRYADKIDEPLLLIHGAVDNNAGTYPIQSERLFGAMQGLGGRVRYVVLPAEAHGYRAKESALHVLWEQVRWLETHVKNAKPRKPAK